MRTRHSSLMEIVLLQHVRHKRKTGHFLFTGNEAFYLDVIVFGFLFVEGGKEKSWKLFNKLSLHSFLLFSCSSNWKIVSRLVCILD